MRGLLHIYTGDGKGKTTAAIGVAVRAAGRGRRILMIQFLKDNRSGEIAQLRCLGITVRGLSKQYGFTSTMDKVSKLQVVAEHNQLLQQAITECRAGEWDLLILDEIMAAKQLQMVEPEQIEAFIAHKPKELELVLTGRNAPQNWVEIADYVTEMKLHKHPYQQGIAAREGIEY